MSQSQRERFIAEFELVTGRKPSIWEGEFFDQSTRHSFKLWQAAEAQALERAAQVCNVLVREQETIECIWVAEECAEKIRTLAKADGERK